MKVQALVDAATRQGELEAAAAEAAAELDRVVRSDDEKERSWAMIAETVKRYLVDTGAGYTPGCNGCKGIKNRWKYRQGHNGDCRNRVAKQIEIEVTNQNADKFVFLNYNMY